MDEGQLLASALRFPSRVPVRLTLLDRTGAKVPGGPWPAQGVDVSKSGVRLEAAELPPDVVKRLGDYDAEYRVELSFEVPGGALPVVGSVRWLKDYPGNRWLVGVEYLDSDIGRGEAIARHFERQFTRPKTTRSAVYGAGVVAVLFGAFFLEMRSRNAELVQVARQRVDIAVEEKQSVSVLLETLESRLATMVATTAGNAGPSRTELAREILDLRHELERAREKVNRESVLLSRVAPTQGRALGTGEHVARGDGFFNQGNLSAALLEYEKAIALDASVPETWLKAGIIHEFQERPVRALEAYGRYLDLRRDAPDWHEVNARIRHLVRDTETADL